MGFKIFDALINTDISAEEQEKSTFHISAAREAKAPGQTSNEGFVVLMDSSIATSVTNSFPKAMKKLRDVLISEETLIETTDKIFFSQDYLFSSPSATAIILDRSVMD